MEKPAVWSTAAAACVLLVCFTVFQFLFLTIGTVRMQINPDLQISVNRLNRVISVEALNGEGAEVMGMTAGSVNCWRKFLTSWQTGPWSWVIWKTAGTSGCLPSRMTTAGKPVGKPPFPKSWTIIWSIGFPFISESGRKRFPMAVTTTPS